MGAHMVDSSVIICDEDGEDDKSVLSVAVLPLGLGRRSISLESSLRTHLLLRPLFFGPLLILSVLPSSCPYLAAFIIVSSNSVATRPNCPAQLSFHNTTSFGINATTSPSSILSVANTPLPATLWEVVQIRTEGERAMPAVVVHHPCRARSAEVGRSWSWESACACSGDGRSSCPAAVVEVVVWAEEEKVSVVDADVEAAAVEVTNTRVVRGIRRVVLVTAALGDRARAVPIPAAPVPQLGHVSMTTRQIRRDDRSACSNERGLRGVAAVVVKVAAVIC
mmetsp:Transcript_9671/g.27105  ORF Transcript_9671/g.27105 Transcript_9671/m.27105 type:complete len:279 (+) Transcript_9671:749-1585(+)